MMKMKVFLAIALPACLLASTALAADVGGTYSTAEAITLGTWVNEYWEKAADKDWFKFKLAAGVDYAFSIGSSVDGAALRLRKPNRSIAKEALSSTDFTNGFEYRATITGTWYLEVIEAGSPEFPRFYQITAHRDCRGNQTTKCALAVGGSQYSHMVFADDGDAYKITVDKAKTYTFTMDYSGVDGWLTILKADGTALPIRPDSTLYNRKIRISNWRPVYTGVHYILVSDTTDAQDYTIRLSTP
jgi:hypothetical protein